jgi:phage shock protein C
VKAEDYGQNVPEERDEGWVMSTTPFSDPDSGERTFDRETASTSPTATDSGPVTERPPLRRSTSDKVVAGVAGGLGRYLAVDPIIVRIALVVFALSGGAGVLLYIIAWIAIPEERPGELPAVTTQFDRNNGVIILGATLLIAGGLLFADRLVPTFSSFVGPLMLIALGVALVLGARR